MRRKPTGEETAQYLRRITTLENHIVLPARVALVLSCLVFLWPIIRPSIGVRQFALFKWAIFTYAALGLAYWIYVFRFAPRPQGIGLTKGVAFASALTDNLFLGLLRYAVMLGPVEQGSLATAEEASIFWLYCGLVLRNTLLFQGTLVQMFVNCLCIVGYIGGALFSGGNLQKTFPTASEERELILRVVVLALVSICSSAVYSLAQRRRREIDEAHERAIRSQRLDMAGMLAAQVAHELKNPLSIMTNAAFLARRSSAPLDPKLDRQLDIIAGEINRADTIITELLDYAKLAEGKIEGVLVNDSIDESLEGLQHELEGRGIEVQREYALDLPFLFIDRGQLRQVFSNILLNACEAIENGGKITVTTRYSGDGFIEVSIADTGKGMSREVLSSIFKPSFTTKEKGSGMGLSIAQNVIRAYKGEIGAESEAGTGTTFHLRFPTRMGRRGKEGSARALEPSSQIKTAVRRAHA